MNVFLQILQFTILIIILVLCILILIKVKNTQSEDYSMEECSNFQNADECNNAKNPSGESLKCKYMENNEGVYKCMSPMEVCSKYGSQDCDNAKDANGVSLKCAYNGEKCVYME